MTHHTMAETGTDLEAAIRGYWDQRIHDTELSTDPAGSVGYFAAMDAYRYGRLEYLESLADFESWKDHDILDIGCGAGLDLMRFARAGARAVGADPSQGAIDLARRYFQVSGQRGALIRADGTRLPFRDESFDLVFCHGVLPFARDCAAIVAEAWRVLRDGGTAIFMACNRRSWMHLLRALAAVPTGHGDAPVFRMHTRSEFEALLAPFDDRVITGERLPGQTTRNRGLRSFLQNQVLARGIRLIPKRWISPLGWHLIARCKKHGPAVRAARTAHDRNQPT